MLGTTVGTWTLLFLTTFDANIIMLDSPYIGPCSLWIDCPYLPPRSWDRTIVDYVIPQRVP